MTGPRQMTGSVSFSSSRLMDMTWMPVLDSMGSRAFLRAHGVAMDAESLGDGGAGDIGVQNTHLIAPAAHGDSQLAGDHGLAYPPPHRTTTRPPRRAPAGGAQERPGAPELPPLPRTTLIFFLT